MKNKPLMHFVLLILNGISFTSGCEFRVGERCLIMSPYPVPYANATEACDELQGGIVLLEDNHFKDKVIEAITASTNFTKLWVNSKDISFFQIPEVTNKLLVERLLRQGCGIALDSAGHLVSPNYHQNHNPLDISTICPHNFHLHALCDVTKRCPAPSATGGMTLLTHSGLYKAGEKAILGCSNGYVNHQSKYQTHFLMFCLHSGEWSKPMPSCSETTNIKVRYVKTSDEIQSRKSSSVLKCINDEIKEKTSFSIWTKDGSNLEEYKQNSKNGYNITTSGDLQFADFNFDDIGRYTCYGKLPDNSISPIVNYELDVNYYCVGSYIYETLATEPVTKVVLTIGESVLLHCDEFSSKTEFRWYKDSEFILGDSNQIIQDDGSLWLKNVTLAHASYYICMTDGNEPICSGTYTYKMYEIVVLPELKEYCGIMAEDRIEDAPLTRHEPRPWSLNLFNSDCETRNVTCVGTLIDHNIMVTAASCFDGIDIEESNKKQWYLTMVQYTDPNYLRALRLEIKFGTPGKPIVKKNHTTLYIAIKKFKSDITIEEYKENRYHFFIKTVKILQTASQDNYSAIAIITFFDELKPLRYQEFLRPLCIKDDIDLSSNRTIYHSIFRPEPYKSVSSLMSIQENCTDISDQQFCAIKLTADEEDEGIRLVPGSALEVYENGRWYLGGVFTHVNESYYYFTKVETIQSLLHYEHTEILGENYK